MRTQKNYTTCSSRKYPDPTTEGISLKTPPPPWIFHFCRELMTPHLLMKCGKQFIKSATIVANQGKPKNIRFIAANSHVGRWLWCRKRPPKTEDCDTASTHHQHAHLLNAKLTMFNFLKLRKGKIFL